ncbi:MAG: flagellar hook-basal body complex protein [Bacillota bacterium]
MIRSLYSGVSGLRNHQIRMDVIGNNIANVNTTGFKGSRANFQDVLSQTIRPAGGPGTNYGSTNPSQVGLGMSLAGISTNMGQGALQNTGRTLDVAIQGNGFFVVQKPDGNRYATREGIFFVDSQGYLVNSNGYFICDSSGTSIQVTTDPNTLETIAISDTGEIKVNGSTIAQRIGLAFFPNPEGLEKIGQNLYRATDASGGNSSGSIDTSNISAPGTTGTGIANTRLASGYLEMSNVDLSEEFTSMIVTQRGYQANARVITVSDTLLQELVDLKR